jgi:beta-glucosidase
VQIISSATDDVGAAQAAAAQADVTIVVAGTTTGESQDRPNLNLDGAADQLISAVAAAARQTVVLAMIPGAVVMPWRGQVDAIAALFLGGEATGTAFASVVFGDHAPTGRLPVMIPATDADTVQPSGDAEVTYSEGLETSYRSTTFNAAFPFGHGLTFTNFSFSTPTAAPCAVGTCVTTTVTNTGAAAAQAVPQLYIAFPAEAKHPAPFLKGFKKTAVLQPGASEDVMFELGDKELSYWAGGWVKAASVVAHVGASSADFRSQVVIGGSEMVLV